VAAGNFLTLFWYLEKLVNKEAIEKGKIQKATGKLLDQLK
jgi:hypothetical protein